MSAIWGDDFTIYDTIDFDDIDPVGWTYSDHPGASPERELGTEICRRIPRPYTTRFGSLFKAYKLLVIKHKLTEYYLPTDRWGPKWFGSVLVDDHRARKAGIIADWTVPWQRMRDADGRCRSPERPGQVIYENDDLGNRRYEDEGGRLYSTSGQAEPTLRFDIDHAVRRGLITFEFA